MLFRKFLLSNGVSKSNIAYYNFEDLDHAHLLDALSLHNHLKEKYFNIKSIGVVDGIPIVHIEDFLLNG
ncbi:MAG: hypothetical protein FWE25_09255 [Lachnospiraceae bacterium]|nr:hypothetical protein [Lachnospiraceae bacterium]